MAETCDVCGNNLMIHFPEVQDPITKEVFAVHKCNACGLGHTLPRPKEISRYYGDAYYGNRHSFTSKYCRKRRYGFVNSVIHQKTGKKLLDVGCGDGSFLLAAKEAGWEVVGTEINPYPARSNGLEVSEDVDQLPDGDRFDCISMWHTLEHMTDITSTLSKLSLLLKPDGKIIIAVPDNGGYQARIFKHRWLHLDVPRHLYHFDSHSLSLCLKRFGFNIQDQWHQELEYDLMGWSQSALNGIFSTPNVFFDYLTGKQSGNSLFSNISSLLLGSILTAIFLPAIPLGTILGRGGTLIAAACPVR